MDKMGLASLIGGLILVILGIYAVITFWQDFIMVLKGIGGIIMVFFGILLAIFGVLLIKD
jgi:hypothetical protein